MFTKSIADIPENIPDEVQFTSSPDTFIDLFSGSINHILASRELKTEFKKSLRDIQKSWNHKEPGYNIPENHNSFISKFNSPSKSNSAFYNIYILYNNKKITSTEFEKYITQYMQTCLKGVIGSLQKRVYRKASIYTRAHNPLGGFIENKTFENDFYRAILQWGIETQRVSREQLPKDDKFQVFYDQVKSGEDTGVGNIYQKIISHLL